MKRKKIENQEFFFIIYLRDLASKQKDNIMIYSYVLFIFFVICYYYRNLNIL